MLQELDVTREQLESSQKLKEELEMKSKSDIKVLVKEVKSLRKAQTELKQELNQSLKEKAELEVVVNSLIEMLSPVLTFKQIDLPSCCH